MRLNVLNVIAPTYVAADKSAITALVQFEGIAEQVPFTATADDVEEHGRDLYARLKAGEFGTVGAFVPQPEPVPMTISDRQFFQALATAGLITKDEALAAVMTGALPASLEGFVDVMTPAEQFAARMKLSGATTFRRDDELVSVIGALQGMTEDEIDNLWRTAAVL